MKHLTSLVHVVLAALLGLFLFSGAARAESDDAARLMARADCAYAGRLDVNQAEEAADIYERILAGSPDSFEASWKLSRALSYIAEHSPARERRLEASGQAVAWGEKAVALKPDDAGAYFWLGLAHAMYGDAHGIMASLNMVPPLKEALGRSIELDPSFMGGAAHMLMGRVLFLLPGLFGGDNEEAMRLLETALRIGPTFWANHLYLAEVYEEEGRKEEAVALLHQVVEGKPAPDVVPEYLELRKKALRLLKEWGEPACEP